MLWAYFKNEREREREREREGILLPFISIFGADNVPLSLATYAFEVSISSPVTELQCHCSVTALTCSFFFSLHYIELKSPLH
jgi:hypothetical protein